MVWRLVRQRRIRRGDLLRGEFVYHKRLMMHERRGSWFEGLEAPKAVRGIRCQANRRLSILRCWL